MLFKITIINKQNVLVAGKMDIGSLHTCYATIPMFARCFTLRVNVPLQTTEIIFEFFDERYIFLFIILFQLLVIIFHHQSLFILYCMLTSTIIGIGHLYLNIIIAAMHIHYITNYRK